MNRKLLLLLAGLFTATLTHAQDKIVLKNGTEIKANVLEVSATAIKYRKQDNPNGPVYTSGIGEVLLINYANGTKDVLGRSAPGLSPAGQVTPSTSLLTPTATTPSSRPSIDGLRYEGGWFSRRFTTASGQTLPKHEVRSLLLDQPDALRAFDQGQSLRRWTYITGGAAVLLVGAGAAVAAFGEGDSGHDTNRMDGFGYFDHDGPTGIDNTTIDHNRGEGAAIVGAAVAGTGVLVGIAALILDHRGTRAFRRAADRYHAQTATSLHLTPGYRGMGIGLALRF